MAKNNPSKGSSSSNRGAFLAVLLVIALFGAGTLLFMQKQPSRSSGATNSMLEELRSSISDAGPPQPYVMGDTNAPVLIEEFADYQCPSCAHYATLTEPDVRKRIVEPGLAYYKFYEYPLPGHNHSPAASLAAACADEQGKFWEMHHQIFNAQDQWGFGPDNREATAQPKPVFKRLAESAGLDIGQWESCYDDGKYNERVRANAAEGLRRNVQSTPTFFINGKMVAGAISYDEMKRLVDEAAQSGTATSDSALGNIIQH